MSTEDRERVLRAGLTEQEADCWALVGAAAQAMLQLPFLAGEDTRVCVEAIRSLQCRLLARPAFRLYRDPPGENRPGHLEVGCKDGTVVVNLDRTRTGHLVFSPAEAEGLAELLRRKAAEVQADELTEMIADEPAEEPEQ